MLSNPAPIQERAIERLCTDAMYRVASLLGIAFDMDDPEQALVSAVERAVAALVVRAGVRPRVEPGCGADHGG